MVTSYSSSGQLSFLTEWKISIWVLNEILIKMKHSKVHISAALSNKALPKSPQTRPPWVHFLFLCFWDLTQDKISTLTQQCSTQLGISPIIRPYIFLIWEKIKPTFYKEKGLPRFKSLTGLCLWRWKLRLMIDTLAWNE